MTDRELQGIDLIGLTLPNADIAEQLGVSINSVKSYIRSAYRRLGIDSRPAAILWARGFAPPKTNGSENSAASHTGGSTDGESDGQLSTA
ncbi:response regulator transcription factor [Phycicoccus elongatus]|uniref:response regulator transcription factor n=1 Tax=Phycicoccus elongatus TaxID=101689 RepID=UPI00227729D4|nr:helix-turn-helix transcriptional regulator [Phycicoccus elongatus]